mgnify:CR=1 FL=1
MYVKEVTVENQVGLHARPATFLSLIHISEPTRH